MSSAKRCPTCKKILPLSDFGKDRRRPSKLKTYCKKCSVIRTQNWTLKNKQKKLDYDKTYRAANRERMRARDRAKYYKDPEATKARIREKYRRNAARIKEKAKAYRKVHPALANAASKKWKAVHREQFRASQRLRLKTDHNFRLSRNLRTSLSRAIRRGSKSGSALALLGCSLSRFKSLIASKFSPGMTWENYGYSNSRKVWWELDHIVALRAVSSTGTLVFDMSKPEDQSKAFHYTNLQPLWRSDNLKKSNKHEELRREGNL